MRSSAPTLLPIFRSQHQGELLSWLFMHPDQEFPLSALAARLNVPLTTLHREVERLVHAELLTSRPVGRTRLLSANSRHRMAAPLTRLLELSFGPQVVIEEEFAVAGAAHVLIFGSWADRYAGHEGPPPNDIDVLVVGSTTRADMYDAADRAQTRLGIPVNAVLRSLEQWTGDDPLSAQIRSAPVVTISPNNDETRRRVA